MTRLVWAAAGTRTYEAGIDRGVLYVGDAPGVPWSGLISVDESPANADAKAYYLDGVKYAQRIAGEEYEATIEAYTYPEEFAACDGSKLLANGLVARHQKRKPFGFTYRTRIGNDLLGLDYGYKIHIVYNAMAEPSQHNNKTLAESTDVFNFSWRISTKPPVLDFRPTAHFTIDSRRTPSALLRYIEDILYGTDLQTARLPSAGELAQIFTTFQNPVLNAGDPNDVYYYTYDGGGPTGNRTESFDGGTP